MSGILAASLAAVLLVAPACGGDDDGDGSGADSGPSFDSGPTFDAAPSTITVEGTVVDGEGRPHSNVSVFIQGSDPTATDGSGNFTITGVQPPYDLTVTAALERTAVHYVGLTSASPVLGSIANRSSSGNSGTIQGTASQGASDFQNPGLVNYRTEYRLRAARAFGSRLYTGVSSTSPFDFAASWGGSGTLSGTVHALQYVQVDGVATDFTGYGSGQVTNLADGGTEDVAISMGAVTDEQIAGSINFGDAISATTVDTAIRFNDGLSVRTSQSEMTDTFDHLLPDGIAGASGCVEIRGVHDSGGVIVSYRGNVSLPATDLAITPAAEVATQVSPLDGASGIGVGAELEFTGPANTAHVVALTPVGGTGEEGTVAIVTTQSSATIPNTAPLGVALAEDQEYSWSLLSFHGVASTDDAGQILAGLGDLCGLDSLDATSSAARSFTTP